MVGGQLPNRQRYITPETAARTVLTQLSSESRLIVTGQIGCGKTTLSREISARLGLTHLLIDVFNSHADPKRAAVDAARSIEGGWVAEANVWQIPRAIWESSDFAIFLDYGNLIHYLRIIRRCLRECALDPTWANIRHQVDSELEHLKIMYLYANSNREGWQKRGGITDTATQVVRCTSPREANRLLDCIVPTRRMHGGRRGAGPK
jgi:adenylate kinase family enzyme